MFLSVLAFVAGSAVAFIVCQVLLLAAIRRMEADTSPQTIRKAALVSLLGYLRSIFLVTTLTSGVVALLAAIAIWTSGTTVAQVHSAVARFQHWRTVIGGLNV